MKRDRDPQLERLEAQLRERGVPPGRDLWPDIDAGIRQREQAGIRPARSTWWRAAAAAVALLVLVAGARQLLQTAPNDLEQVPVVATADDNPAPAGGMAAIERALGELGQALAADPDNPNLSRLVLMVHRTRGELLRRNPEPGPRAG